MPLTPGARLGPYEILGSLGAGGMGEVYKARDSRLERVVALKVIQGAIAASAEMRERFEREARAISALDHPNICVLHDVSREADLSFLVMQYLEGETLADRLARAGKPASDPTRPSSGSGETSVATISRGPLSFDTALKYATEIAGALDAAHRRGIVHRDLKPGNVMITKTGTKLLDFGLAKLAAKDEGLFAGDGATRTSPLTSQGAILGTLSYMSPEQLEGMNVDARSDIHAFGAVLFEMLSGRRAFEGQSQASIITAIVGGDPPTLTQLADSKTSLPRSARRALDRVFAKCFAKNPDERWQSAADLADELRWINEERQRPAAVEPPPVAPAESVSVERGSRTRERIWMGVAAASLLVAAGIAYAWFPRAAGPSAPITFGIAPPDGVTLAPGPGLLSISPDGTRVAFITGGPNAGGQLWIRKLDALAPERLARADGAFHVAWSPNGQSLAFIESGRSGPLRRLDLSGSNPRTLAPAAAGRPAWSPAGVIVFLGNDARLYKVSADGAGDPQLAMDIDKARQEIGLDWPMFLPDGRRYLFIAHGPQPALFLASLDAPGRTHLLNLNSSVEYAAGYLFYQTEGTLMAHPFDADAARFTGEPFRVVEDIRYSVGNGRGAFSVSASGSLVYLSGGALSVTADRRLAVFDQGAKAARPVASPGPYVGTAMSPDGRQAIIVQQVGSGAVRSLWLLDIERGVLSRFTPGDDDESAPLWSPDGNSVVFRSTREGGKIYRRASGGAATTAELLFGGTDNATPSGFSRDGQHLLFTHGRLSQQRLWLLPLSGDRKPIEVFPGSTRAQNYGEFSPDGKWIAYSDFLAAAQPDVYIQPYPPDGRSVRVTTGGGGRFPSWSADGTRLVYRLADGRVMSVNLTNVGGMLQPSKDAVQLFTSPVAGTNLSYLGFSADRDLKRFLVIQPPANEAPPTPTPITVVVNFVQSLKK